MDRLVESSRGNKMARMQSGPLDKQVQYILAHMPLGVAARKSQEGMLPEKQPAEQHDRPLEMVMALLDMAPGTPLDKCWGLVLSQVPALQAAAQVVVVAS